VTYVNHKVKGPEAGKKPQLRQVRKRGSLEAKNLNGEITAKSKLQHRPTKKKKKGLLTQKRGGESST